MLTRRAILVVTFCTAALLSFGLATPPQDPPTPVKVTIDYHDGVQKIFTNIAFTRDMTVADALKAASEHPRGVKIEHKGSGDTFFLVKIDDLKNQGAGKEALNWQYWVNGKLGTVGCGAAKIQPGDTVLWAFELYKQP